MKQISKGLDLGHIIFTARFDLADWALLWGLALNLDTPELRFVLALGPFAVMLSWVG